MKGKGNSMKAKFHAALAVAAGIALVQMRVAEAADRPPSNGVAGINTIADEICSIAGVRPVGTNGVTQVDFTLRPERGSDIRCRAELPPSEKWDGRLWGKGNSGVGGRLPSLHVRYMAGAELPAVVTTDIGTRAVVEGRAASTSIWSEAVLRDYSWRATHLMTVYGKRLVTAFYGRPARKAYFVGGSCGGRQGFHEAMRFPEDYDGIVASLPANNVVPNKIGKWHLWRMTHDKDGLALFTKEEMRAVADAAVEFRAASDPKPYAGHYLADGRATGEEIDGMLALAAKNCPSLARGDKMARLKAIHSPLVVDGACLSLGYAPGTYLGDKIRVNDDAPLRTWLGKQDVALTNWCNVTLKHLREFARATGPELNANPADLSAFFARGGKLIVTTGWEDQTIPPGPIVDQYERLCSNEGGLEKAMERCRLFCMPGVAHGGGKGRATQGAAGSPSLHKAIVEWVEERKAPDKIVIRDGVRKLDLPVATYPGLFVQDGAGEWARVELPRSKPRLSPEVTSDSCNGRSPRRSALDAARPSEKPVAECARIFEAEMRDGVIHGATVMAGGLEGADIVASWGWADAAHTVPMTPRTVIDMASVTKTAAGVTAYLIAHARGKVADFDAPFAKCLAAYSAPIARNVTLRELANHVSGFGEADGKGKRVYFSDDPQTMLRNILSMPPKAPKPGRVVYSCRNYVLLGQAFEATLGCRLADFCRREIFLPAGMADTSLGAPLTSVAPDRLAQTCGTKKAGVISDFVARPLWAAGIGTFNAGLFSTAEDMAKLMRVYLRGGVCDGGTRLFGEAEMALIAPSPTNRVEGARTFGWQSASENLPPELFGTSLFHSGWSGQTVLFDLKRRRYAIVLTTRCGNYKRAKRERFAAIGALLREESKK